MIQLPSMFSNGIVLQRGIKVPVWGWAEPGERVMVSLGTEKVKATAGADRRWVVKFGPLPAGGPFEMEYISKSQFLNTELFTIQGNL